MARDGWMQIQPGQGEHVGGDTWQEELFTRHMSHLHGSQIAQVIFLLVPRERRSIWP